MSHVAPVSDPLALMVATAKWSGSRWRATITSTQGRAEWFGADFEAWKDAVAAAQRELDVRRAANWTEN